MVNFKVETRLKTEVVHAVTRQYGMNLNLNTKAAKSVTAFNIHLTLLVSSFQ